MSGARGFIQTYSLHVYFTYMYMCMQGACVRTLALEACHVQKLFRFRSDQLKLTQLPRGALSCQQEQLPQVHQAPRSSASGMSSEDLAPYLGESWKRDATPQASAEVGM